MLELVGSHAVAVHSHLYDLCLIGAERRDRAGIGGCLADHDVAGVEQRLAGQVDHLLPARRHALFRAWSCACAGTRPALLEAPRAAQIHAKPTIPRRELSHPRRKDSPFPWLTPHVTASSTYRHAGSR